MAGGANALLGDVNGDGKVTIQDAVVLANYIIGNSTSIPFPANADVNQDGKITTADALLILQVASGLRTSFTYQLPTILTVAPLNGTTNAPVTSNISVFFSGAVSPASLNAGLVVTDTTAGSSVAGTIRISQDGVIATFIPAQPLPASHGFAISVSTVVTDVVGNHLTQGVSSAFKTQALGTLNLISVNGATTTINTLLAQPITAQAFAPGGAPAYQAPVMFTAVMGNGTFQPSGSRQVTVLTDSNGMAQASYQTGNQAIENTVQIGAVGFSSVPIFSVNTQPTPAVNLRLFSGSNQNGAPGTTTALPLMVQVTDSGGDEISGTTVTFIVRQGQGNFLGQGSATAVSDSSGTASTFFTFGAASGTVLVQAHFAGMVGQPATFTLFDIIPQIGTYTYVSGTVVDAQTLQPLNHVYVYLADNPSVWDWTDPAGSFQFPASPGAHIVEVDGFESGMINNQIYPVVAIPTNLVQGQRNFLSMPALLPELDQQSYIDVSDIKGGTLTLRTNPLWQLYVAPGSAHFVNGTRTGRIYVAAVPPDKIPMPLAGGKTSQFVDTIQPLNVIFDPPAQVNFPNVDHLAPGTISDIFTLSYASGTFVRTGKALVSANEAVVQSLPGQGIRQGGWHSAPPPSPRPTTDPIGRLPHCDPAQSMASSCGNSGPISNGLFSISNVSVGCDPPATQPGIRVGLLCKYIDLKIPGDCSWQEQQDLQNDVEVACFNFSCDGLNDKKQCVEIRINEAQAASCIAAQMKINKKCFRGGDPGHRKKLDDAVKALIKCQAKATFLGC